MLNRRVFVATMAIGALGLPQVMRGLMRPEEEGVLVCAIGDLERTSAAGSVLLAQSTDNAAHQKIVMGVVEEKPSLLLLLGDQVADSGAPPEWAYFDALTRPLRDANILTLAVRGEHDYSLLDKVTAERECAARWPATTSRPQLYTVGPVAFVGVDSNVDLLSNDAARDQQQKFVQALEKYDNDPAIKGVVVWAHHPPYSNSPHGENEDMIAQYAEPFIAAKKTKLFLCGHVHSYERFVFADGAKMFVTSGGGGAPRRSVDVSESRRFRNDAAGPLGSVRPFNYMRLRLTEQAIVGEVMLLQKKGFIVGDRFRLKLA